MRQDIQIDEAILYRYFSNTLSVDEKELVDEWISSSPENKKLAEDIFYLYLSSETLHKIQKANAPAALKNVKKNIRKTRMIYFLHRVQRVAAILLIPLLITTLYLFFKSEPEEIILLQTNPGMIASVTLPDGSQVWLNSRSTLKHPARFTGNKREVELDGEAYFQIKKDLKKRFVVNTSFDLQAEVLGTEFNMEAYKKDKQIITTLVSGSVKVHYKNNLAQYSSYILKPGEEFSYTPVTGHTEVNLPFLPTLTAWKDGLVIFRNTSFEEALRILGKRFNVDFEVKNQKLYDHSFTGPFDGHHLQLILEHFRLSSGIQYRFIDPEEEEVREKIIVELY